MLVVESSTKHPSQELLIQISSFKASVPIHLPLCHVPTLCLHVAHSCTLKLDVSGLTTMWYLYTRLKGVIPNKTVILLSSLT